MDKQEHDRAGDPQFPTAGSSGVGKNVYLSLDQLKTQVTDHVTDSFSDKLRARDTQLVSSIGTLIDSKLESLRTEISQKASHLKYNEPKTFKRKGNEKQFKINAQVIDQLDIASEQLEANKLNKVRDTLAEGMRILKERQKLILIADSEKHGWKVARKVGSRGTRVLVAPEGSTLADSSPRGRLCDQLNFWMFMTQSDLILGVVREGYRIPFFLEPPARQFSNNKSALLHSDFVSNEISSLLLKGCITELAEGQLYKCG